jgi:hypothetical protein
MRPHQDVLKELVLQMQHCSLSACGDEWFGELPLLMAAAQISWELLNRIPSMQHIFKSLSICELICSGCR